MSTRVFKKIGRIALRSAGALLLLIIILIGLIYVPVVQDIVVPRVLRSVNEGRDTTFVVEGLRLRFPLDLTVRDAAMLAGNDTAISVRNAHLDVSLMPLLRGDIRVSDVALDRVYYRQGTPDSTLYMTARLRDARLNEATVAMSAQDIDVDRLSASGIRVDLTLLNDTTVTPPDTTQVSWRIHARQITLADVDYRMQMLPTIDSLVTHIGSARLTEGNISLAARTIDVGELAIDSVAARYLLPDAQYLATHPIDTISVAAADSVPPSLWTIRGTRISLTHSDALYAVAGAEPQPGLDMNYLQVSDVNIRVDSFYNRGVEIIVPLRELTATERCGIRLDASGTFAMDSAMMHARGFRLTTMFSDITLDAAMGVGDLTTDPTLPLRLNAQASVGLKDIGLAIPSLDPMLSHLPHDNDLTLTLDINGSLASLEISRADLTLPEVFELALNGNVNNITDIDRTDGSISLTGTIRDGEMLKPTLLQANSGTVINIPPMSVRGDIRARSGVWSGKMSAVTHGGSLALDGMWNASAERYDAELRLNRFPVISFMPGLGVGSVTANLDAAGRGYDLMSPRTDIKAHVDVIDVVYLKRNYTAITADASLAAGNASVRLVSDNRPADFTIDAAGNLSGRSYDWTVDADIRNLDLHAIGLSDSVSNGSVNIEGGLSMTPTTNAIAADISIQRLNWRQGPMTIADENIDLTLSSADTLTSASVTNGDLSLAFSSPMGYDSIMARFTNAMVHIDTVMARHRADIPALQSIIPPMVLTLSVGPDNLVSDILASSDISMGSLTARLTNDSLINFRADINRLTSGTTKLDDITLTVNQVNDELVYRATVDNQPGTMDAFAHIIADGSVGDDRISVMFRQSDIDDRTGYSLGLKARIDTAYNIMVQVVPANPIIAYKDWTVNDGNFITFNTRDMHFAADLEMHNAESRIHVYTGDADTPDTSLAGMPQQDVNLDISDIKLADWLSISPFAPPIKGDLSAALTLKFKDRSVSGTGSASLDNFFYGKKQIGSFDLGLGLETLPGRALKADVSLDVNGQRTITASGILNDTTAVTPMNVNVTVDRFPLSIVNPFMPTGTASLAGTLNGEMKATGRAVEPILNGWLAFDSTAVDLAMTGTTYRFSDRHIPVTDNVVSFDGFTITGTNDNPLIIDGIVDATSFISPKINLHLMADEFGIVNTSRRAKGASVYGRAYVDLDARVRGTLSMLNVDASLNLLPETNVTYVLATDVTTLSTQSKSDMVRFVNFNDTTAVAKADTIAPSGMLLNLDALLTVSDGSTINVDLSADGKNKASVKSNGSLNMHIDPMGDMRLTGRLNLDEGFVRYTPPFMSEKLFNFVEGSYVAFNGDVMNPLLNLHAIDRIRANVTKEGENSRLIYFDVALNVTGSLNDMNVAFDLSTDDDITVQNELQSMSADQRANQAMNLLLYNMYTGKGTSANANLSGNMLYSFLTSQINNWAANNIKGVDISFGIDQYDKTVDGSTSQTMSYSYRVSKSLFNDRFKIIVGGNYSTDADADENFSQNLINDISFEYLLNRTGTMYVRLFRHTGYESILEGEITRTGVGFVYKRKLRSLRNIFRSSKSENNQLPDQGQVLKPIKPQAIKQNEDENAVK